MTPEELESVKINQRCSGMWMSGGQPLGDPQKVVFRLTQKYQPPEGAGLNLQTGEFCLP